MFELLLFTIGVALIIYPPLDRIVQEQKQSDLLTQWETKRNVNGLSDESINFNFHPYKLQTNLENKSVTPREEQADPQEKLLMIEGEEVMGTITIEKINLREPMLARTTDKTLKLGVGSVVTDVFPGHIGNFVLAGHRSRTYGKQFNRLDEMETGDLIILETLDHHFVYEVVSKFIVEPDGVFVLDQNVSGQELTLITCEPVRNPTHRLIVKASLLQTSIADEIRKVKPL
ncbi:class D sortase [Caldalkalibacillus mannanilyticus]|uniref:class D sortase n=1 Tax=Caldalkalibacillus mannanilyticus TaxID=1418 RepID=UPI00046883E1|nr:class D sortase [Caldalkalibacillus mannanilyticus]